MTPRRPHRRAGLLVAALHAALAGTSLPAQDAPAAAERPNILFALADDWGWPHAGAYGDPVVATPTFDRLAREGVLFERAFVSSPSCTPSRNAILTGQQFYRLGEGANLHSTLGVAHPTFTAMLHEAGYQIGHWRKAWGPGDYKAGGYAADPCGPRSTFETFLQRRDPDKPFCFWFGTSDPHRGYRRHSGRENGIDPDAVRVPAYWPDHEDVRGDVADYYFEVQRWDRDVGRALALLEQAGELDRTLVVMSGDHGMPFPRCKGNLYDCGVRVPLAVRWGGIAAPGRTVTSSVSLTDLAPTFLAAAGIAPPPVMTGRSLLPNLAAADAAGRDCIVFGRERHTPAQAIPAMTGYPARGLRTERWLLILNLEPERWPAGVPKGSTHPMDVHADCDDGPTKQLLLREPGGALGKFWRLCFAQRPAVELYDCHADPDQICNLADAPEHAARVAALSEQLTVYLRETADPRFTDAPVRFDDYPYRAKYLQQRLEQWRQRQRR